MGSMCYSVFRVADMAGIIMCERHGRRIIYVSLEKKYYCEKCLDELVQAMKDLSSHLAVALDAAVKEMEK